MGLHWYYGVIYYAVTVPVTVPTPQGPGKAMLRHLRMDGEVSLRLPRGALGNGSRAGDAVGLWLILHFSLGLSFLFPAGLGNTPLLVPAHWLGRSWSPSQLFVHHLLLLAGKQGHNLQAVAET